MFLVNLFAFVHGHGAQFLLSQNAIYYDVQMRRLHCESHLCVLHYRKQPLKSFPREGFWFIRIWKIPSFFVLPFVLTKISKYHWLPPPLPPNCKNTETRTKHDKLTQFFPKRTISFPPCIDQLFLTAPHFYFVCFGKKLI